MNNYSQEEINKMDEAKKFEIIIDDINEAVNSKDEKRINDLINQIANNIKNLLNDTNRDKIAYIVIRFLNKIVSTDPRIRTNACENLDESIVSGLDDIDFEKQSLLELKKYLKNSKKTKNYDKLSLSFSILIAIFFMHNNRKDKICIDADVWRCGINGIRYMAVETTNSKMNKLREPIEEGIQKLKK